MRWLALLLALLVPLTSSAQVATGPGAYSTGPRILGEPAFAFEADLLSQAEASRSAFPITTTRASTAMCQLADGTWQTVAAGVPCIGAKGMESWAGGTNYWTDSTNPSAWRNVGAGTTSAVASVVTASAANTGRKLPADISNPALGDWTVTCEMAAGTTTSVTLGIWTNTAGYSPCSPTTLSATAKRYSCTKTLSGAPTAMVAYFMLDTAGTVAVPACQLEKSPTPGPRVDCGGSPCSRANDWHRFSTAGLPVASGEIRLRYTPGDAGTSAGARILFDTRKSDQTGGLWVSRNDTNSLSVEFRGASGSVGSASTGALTWSPTVEEEIVVRWTSGGTATITRVRDGATASTSIGTVGAHAAQGTLGASNVSGNFSANGGVRLIRVTP